MFYDVLSDYKALLPEVWQDVVEIDVIAEAVNSVFDKMNRNIKKWIDNKSIDLADEDGVLRWEKILEVSSPINSSLEARKGALKASLIANPPINLKMLQAIIEAYMGLPVDIVVEDYQIYVWYRGTSRISDLAPLYKTAEILIPANLILYILYRYLIWDELDEQNLSFDELDTKNVLFDEFEKGEWINGSN